jgi:hypothetical protein
MTTTQIVQLPPDGVGKSIRHRLLTDIKIDTSTATVTGINPTIGNVVYGPSGHGTISGIYQAGDLTYYLSDVVGGFAVNDSIQNAALNFTYGKVSTLTANVYTPSVHIADSKTSEYVLTVDRRGAALTSYPEGTPQFDAFGHMQVSQMLAVGEYYHFAQDLAGKYYQQTSGAGTVVHNPLLSSMVYTVGTTAGDLARRVTNQYHPYKPGVSNLIYTSCSMGDLNSGITREWGYFDDNNGFGFRLVGSNLYVFLRSDVSGTPQDVAGGAVLQDNWNVNTLKGTSADFVLDVTKSNIYWMDITGTAGRVRLGVETPDGRRITCHQFQWGNNYTGPNCRNLNLPMQWRIYNSSGGQGTSSTMRIGVGVVFTESADVLYTGVLTHITPDSPVLLQDSNFYTPFLCFKAKTTIAGPTVLASTMTAGVSYTIVSLGTTSNWSSIGAPGATPGLRFTATGAGNGTGTVYQNVQNSIIGIHETFDWASAGPSNLHVGIFVCGGGENYLTGYQWSETIDPTTMLYVDQSITAMPQYIYWDGTSTTFTGNISGTTLYVTSTPSPGLYKEMFLTEGAAFGLAPKTKVLRQLTSTETAVATPTATSTTVAGAKWLTVNDYSKLYQTMIVAGPGLPAGTYVEQVTSTGNILISEAFTTAVNASGTYAFYAQGGKGAYRVDTAQTYPLPGGGATTTGIGAAYRFKPQESFMAPANSSGRAALGDRIEKSFYLGPNLTVQEDAKGIFIFAAKVQAQTNAGQFVTGQQYTIANVGNMIWDQMGASANASTTLGATCAITTNTMTVSSGSFIANGQQILSNVATWNANTIVTNVNGTVLTFYPAANVALPTGYPVRFVGAGTTFTCNLNSAGNLLANWNTIGTATPNCTLQYTKYWKEIR